MDITINYRVKELRCSKGNTQEQGNIFEKSIYNM